MNQSPLNSLRERSRANPDETAQDADAWPRVGVRALLQIVTVLHRLLGAGLCLET